MQDGFWNSISKIVITSSLMIGVQSAVAYSPVAGQDVVQDQSAKKTVEPIFRVSKLVGKPSTTLATEQSQFVEQRNLKQVPSVGQQPEPSRVADVKGLPAGNMIPGAGVSTTPAPANSAAPKPVNVAPFEATTRSDLASSAAPILPSTTPKAVAPTKPAPHPLDRAVEEAYSALEDMRANVFDYTAILSKRENVNGRIGAPSYMQVKFRCPRQLANGSVNPFSIYMKFLKPRDAAGREVIWVDGQNKNNIVAHEAKGTLLGSRKFNLNPTGFLAMKGQRHPIYEAGVENLIVKLIEKAERDRAAGPCVVNYRDNANINNRPCSLIELVHNERRAPYEFHKAQVFIDQELNLPVRYAAYDWPVVAGGEAPLIEEYTYFNVKVNVGLTDMDFNPSNKAYSYPRR